MRRREWNDVPVLLDPRDLTGPSFGACSGFVLLVPRFLWRTSLVIDGRLGHSHAGHAGPCVCGAAEAPGVARHPKPNRQASHRAGGAIEWDVKRLDDGRAAWPNSEEGGRCCNASALRNAPCGLSAGDMGSGGAFFPASALTDTGEV